jgi:hypothetical protein
MTNLHTIRLDGAFSSSLDWKQERKEALSALASGKRVLWHLDLGLFQRLLKPLSDQGQFLNLCLALDHFKDKIWKEFHRFSHGVLLYRIPGNFLQSFFWDAEQLNNLRGWIRERFSSWECFCSEVSVSSASFEELTPAALETSENGRFLLQLFARDVATDYLSQLCFRLPSEIPAYVDFESWPQDDWLKLLLTHPERYKQMELLSDHPWRLNEEKKMGICMPPLSVVQPSLLKPFESFIARSDLKWIPEEMVTASWDGLDQLIYSSAVISQQGLRKIQGFRAAGGEVMDIFVEKENFCYL